MSRDTRELCRALRHCSGAEVADKHAGQTAYRRVQFASRVGVAGWARQIGVFATAWPGAAAQEVAVAQWRACRSLEHKSLVVRGSESRRPWRVAKGQHQLPRWFRGANSVVYEHARLCVIAPKPGNQHAMDGDGVRP